MKTVFLTNALLNMARLFESYKYLIRDQQIAKRLKPHVIRQFEEYLAINEDPRQADLPLHSKIVLVWHALSFLASVLQDAHGKACLVLIDDYDEPIAKAHQSGILKYAMEVLMPMLRGVLKVSTPALFPYFRFNVL